MPPSFLGRYSLSTSDLELCILSEASIFHWSIFEVRNWTSVDLKAFEYLVVVHEVESLCSVSRLLSNLDFSFSFLACGELLGWLGNKDIRRKHWRICNRFPIVSSSAGIR